MYMLVLNSNPYFCHMIIFKLHLKFGYLNTPDWSWRVGCKPSRMPLWSTLGIDNSFSASLAWISPRQSLSRGTFVSARVLCAVRVGPRPKYLEFSVGNHSSRFSLKGENLLGPIRGVSYCWGMYKEWRHKSSKFPFQIEDHRRHSHWPQYRSICLTIAALWIYIQRISCRICTLGQ